MMMMISLWVELKLNRNRDAIQIYTENWKKTISTLYPIERLAPTVNVGLYPEYDTDSWQWQHRNSRVKAGIPVHIENFTRPDPRVK